MLIIYKSLFDAVKRDKIRCCVYKSLNHLDKDLEGVRGDLDIVVKHDDLARFLHVAKGLNFLISKVSNLHYYLFGLDQTSMRTVMIDLSTVVLAGPKPAKPYYFQLDMDRVLIQDDIVPVLSQPDYLLLMLMVRMLSKNEREEDLKELQQLVNTVNVNESYLVSLVTEHCNKDWVVLAEDINRARSWVDLRVNYSEPLSKAFVLNGLKAFGTRLPVMQKTMIRMARYFGFPPYKVNRLGKLIVLIGVDGAGKTSAVNHLISLDIMKLTGVKRIYFGNNEYWMPGLRKLLVKSVTWPRLLRIMLSTIASLDRRARALIAFRHLIVGKTVIADRYYFDDLIGLSINREKEEAGIYPRPNLLKKLYRSIMHPRILMEPDLTLFLSVSPERAYERKQDYSYEKMLEVNQAYNYFFQKMENVRIINCDQPQDVVLGEITAEVIRKVGNTTIAINS